MAGLILAYYASEAEQLNTLFPTTPSSERSLRGYEVARESAAKASGAIYLRDNAELNQIVDQAAAHYDTCFASISLIREDWQLMLSRSGATHWETPRKDAFCAFAIERAEEVLIVPDALADSRFAGLGTVTGAPYIRFYAGISIVDRSGFALGALCVAHNQPRTDKINTDELLVLAQRAARVIKRI